MLVSAVMIADFGSYYCGGTILDVEGLPIRSVPVTRETALSVDENGSHAVGHAYVQYFVPSERNGHPPVVLMHGGGLCGSMWETTPDGRSGWIQRLLSHGFEVHVVDNVERGRAGWSPHVTPGRPVTRTLQDAWTLFRFGRPEDFASRKPFPGQLFPVWCLENLGRFFVPRWFEQSATQADALAAVLRRVGRPTVICHSQGADIAFRAAAQAPESVAALIALEPSGLPVLDEWSPSVPLLLVQGDFLDSHPLWRDLSARCRAFVSGCAAKGAPAAILSLTDHAPGSSHMMMHDLNSDDVLDIALGRAASLG